MKRAARTLALLLAGSSLSLAAHAGLYITGQFLSASALVTSPDGQTQGNTWFWDSGLNLPPQVVSSGIASQGLSAGARQTPDGFFYDEVAFQTGWESPAGLSTMQAETRFKLTVRTDEADTPLILDFHFLGSLLGGGAYYGEGTMTVGASAAISAAKNGDPMAAVWQIEDRLLLDSPVSGSAFQRQSNGTDVQGIGLPLLSDGAYWNGFVSRGEAERQSFVGQLNFGLLQPGEVFRLDYDARAWTASDIRYAGDARAELVDPFSLGGSPPPQIQLQGLNLPVAAVPELASGLALLAGLVLLGAVLRRRHRTHALLEARETPSSAAPVGAAAAALR